MVRSLWIVLVFLAFHGSAEGQANPREQAANHFDRGNALYKQGEFAEAIKAFAEAHRIAPHCSAIFSIARCYENLGDVKNALHHYYEALEQCPDPTKRADIQKRQQRLLSRPTKVFIVSTPSGAEVTVDGREAPQLKKTPTVVQLTAGEHLLLLRREGHLLAAQRVVVELGKEQTVEVTLEALPRSEAPPPSEPRLCPELRLVDGENLHLHLSLLGAFGWSAGRPITAGPGAQLLVTYKRLVFGGKFIGHPQGESTEDIDAINAGITDVNKHYKAIKYGWLLAMVEGGYLFPFRTSFAYTTVGIGFSLDRISFIPTEESDSNNKLLQEKGAFAWSIGGGLEAMAGRWLSFGAALRFGMIHGSRADTEKVGEFVSGNYPFAVLWGSATFHL